MRATYFTKTRTSLLGFKLSRRSFLNSASALALLPFASFKPLSLFADDRVVSPFLTKAIPISGEQIPVIGMGTWQTFDV